MEPKIHYCNKKVSDWKNSHCGNIAEFIVKLDNKNINNKAPIITQYRCSKHKTSATNNKKVIEFQPFDQSNTIKDIQNSLREYIGREIYSSRDKNKYPYIGRYIKECGIMCNPSNNNKVWKYVYYNQIANPFINH